MNVRTVPFANEVSLLLLVVCLYVIKDMISRIRSVCNVELFAPASDSGASGGTSGANQPDKALSIRVLSIFRCFLTTASHPLIPQCI